MAKFRIDQDRLNEVTLSVYEAAQKRTGIFKTDIRRFLPQWNLPSDLEYSPQETETKDPAMAAKYLWVEASFERRTESRDIIIRCARVWEDQRKRWIFDLERVANERPEVVKGFLLTHLNFGINGKNKPDESPTDYQENARLLLNKYDGDPRKMIQGYTVEQARKNMMEFKGIGTGIPNLFILYLLDRKIASPIDPLSALLKVDVHKGRLPLNTECLVPTQPEIRVQEITPALEKAYWDSCNSQSLSPGLLDAALWVIGSEACTKKDYDFCRLNCPLSKTHCVAYTPTDPITGRYLVRNKEGSRTDPRAGKNQQHFDFHKEI